ncbi:site-specific integrase [Cutibacterium avidum]|uniref:Site-specific integrase n=1 Tax=Cutibacterium avidum TaxID=33010 RepID=A0AB35XK45_9ACTN
MSVRKLPPGRYQARFTGPDGISYPAPTTFSTKARARAWEAEERRLVELGTWTSLQSREAAQRAAQASQAAKGVTVGEYVERVVARRASRARKPISPTTADLYRKDWRLRGGDLAGVALGDLTPDLVSRWWEAMPPKTPTQNGRCYDLLKSVLAEAVEDELLDRNPCRVRGAGKPDPARTGQALTVAEVLAYVAAVPERYRAALAVAVWCGLRSGEVRGLRRCDVDLDARVLRVRQGVTKVKAPVGSRTKTLWRVGPLKTKAARRDVALPSVLVEPLRQHLAAAPLTGREGLIFPATDGRSPMPDSVLYEAHAKGRDAIGRDGLRIHDLRRTAATVAAQQGATLAELMRLLGHTTAQMAMVYQVGTDARDRERADKLDAAIRAASA